MDIPISLKLFEFFTQGRSSRLAIGLRWLVYFDFQTIYRQNSNGNPYTSEVVQLTDGHIVHAVSAVGSNQK